MFLVEHRDDLVLIGGQELKLPIQLRGTECSLNIGIEQLNHILLDLNLFFKNHKFIEIFDYKDAFMEIIVFIDKYTAWGCECEGIKVLWAIWVCLRNYLSIQGKKETLIRVKLKQNTQKDGVWLFDTRIEATMDHQQFDEKIYVMIEKKYIT